MKYRIFAFAAISLQALGWQSAFAQNSLTVPIEVVLISNPNLSSGSSESATILRTNPQYTLMMVQGSSRTELSLGGMVERSSNTSLRANRTLPSVRVLWETSSPVVVQSVQASLEEESTRETEFAELGRVSLDSTRRTGTLGAKWSRELTAGSTVELAASHARISYDAPLLVDYSETRGSMEFGFAASAVARYLFATSAEHLNPDGAHSSATRVGAVLGRTMDISEGVTLTATGGAVWISEPRRKTDFVGALRLVNVGDQFDYSLSLSRDVRASGSLGTYVRAQNFDASLNVPLSTSHLVSFGVGHAQSLEADREAGATAHIRIRSELSRFWAATLGLEYRRAMPSGRPSAQSNAATLGLVYAHPDF